MASNNRTIFSADILRSVTQSLFCNLDDSLDVRTVDPVAQSVRRLVDVLCRDYSSDWMQIAADLGISKRFSRILEYPETEKQIKNALNVLEHCATFVLDERELNWGRIVAVFGLYLEMCRGWICQGKTNPIPVSHGKTNPIPIGTEKLRHFIENRLAESFGAFLDNYIGEWVVAHGGWSRLASLRSIAEPATSSCIVDLKKGMFNYISFAVMGMGIGALLGLMVVR